MPLWSAATDERSHRRRPTNWLEPEQSEGESYGWARTHHEGDGARTDRSAQDPPQRQSSSFGDPAGNADRDASPQVHRDHQSVPGPRAEMGPHVRGAPDGEHDDA